jgi:multiple antibiotic resistance protein
MDIYKPLVALLAIVNPVGVVPFFIHFTSSFTRTQRRNTMIVSASTAGIVIAMSALFGLKIIEFFGISLASFQVGGGCLLLISSLQMLNAQPAEARKEDVSEGSSKVDAGASIAVVPLAIPLLTGPATISTMVIYADKTRHWWELAVLCGYGVVVAALAVELLSDGLIKLFPVLAVRTVS